MIEVDGYTKLYGDRVAVSDLSFSVRAGEIVGLVGPNGAGKTTTLRAICGILRPNSGRIVVAGHDVVEDPVAAKRRLALVPDDPHLFDNLTVWEHLDFCSQVYEVPGWEVRGEELLRRFELLDRRGTLAGELSRGMRQKVAVACALLHEPAALLLDEPITGLDPRGIRTLWRAVQDAAARGAAVLLSSHLLSQIESLCTHFVIVREGRRVAGGTKAEIRSALPQLRDDASLEEIFFTATEGSAATEDGAPSP